MKPNLFVLVLSVLLIMYGCSYSTGNDKINLLQNSAQKDEVYSQIFQNEKLFNDFMMQMTERPEAMHWMMQNHRVMNHMYSGDNFRYMMNHNPELHSQMMNSMIQMLSNDSLYRRQWNNMMQQHRMGGGMMMH